MRFQYSVPRGRRAVGRRALRWAAAAAHGYSTWAEMAAESGCLRGRASVHGRQARSARQLMSLRPSHRPRGPRFRSGLDGAGPCARSSEACGSGPRTCGRYRLWLAHPGVCPFGRSVPRAGRVCRAGIRPPSWVRASYSARPSGCPGPPRARASFRSQPVGRPRGPSSERGPP